MLIGSLRTYLMCSCKGNRNVAKVANAAGWGVVAVLGISPTDEDGLTATGPLAEMCGPVVTDPSREHYLGASCGKCVLCLAQFSLV